MSLTTERAEILAKYLLSNEERAKQLVNTPVDEAVKEINADGFDFTVDELKEFGESMKTIAEKAENKDELSMESLEDVSGGLVVSGAVAAALIGAAVTLFTTGVSHGYKVARERGW